MSNLQGDRDLADTLRLGRVIRALVDESRAGVGGGGRQTGFQIAFERGQVAMMLLFSAQNTDDDPHMPSFLDGLFFAFGSFLAQLPEDKRQLALERFWPGVNDGFADFNKQFEPQGSA